MRTALAATLLLSIAIAARASVPNADAD